MLNSPAPRPIGLPVPEVVTIDDRQAGSPATDRPEPEDHHEHEDALDRLVVVALVGFAASLIAAFWVPVLSYGLMTDELLSAWVSSGGFGDAVDRAFTHQGNSPLYFVLLGAWRAVAGSSEVALRLPSVLCMAAAAHQLARLGRELDDGRRVTGVVAAFVLLANTDVMLAGVTARPYALLVLSVVVSMRALVHFLHDGRLRCGLVWVLAAGVSLLMSPFAALALPAHLVALVGAARGRRIAPFGSPAPGVDARIWQRRLPGLLAIGALVVSPLVPQVFALAGRSQELVLVGVPDLVDLVEALVPVPLVAAVAVGHILGGRRRHRQAPDPALTLIVVWALAPIVACWVVSNLTGTSIWVDRYRLGAIPGIALLVGLGVGRIGRSHGRVVASAVLLFFSLWNVSEAAGLDRHGWREAVEWARAETAGEQVTIALDTDLIELQNLELLTDPDWQEYLSGPVQHYGLPGRVVLLPKGPAEAVLAYREQVIDDLSQGRDTVVVISRVLFRGPPDQLAGFRTAMAADGWSETAGPIVGPHQAVVFRRGS